MAVVNIKTFQGIKPIKIAGNAPTAEEIERINQAFPKLGDPVDEPPVSTVALPKAADDEFLQEILRNNPPVNAQVDPQAAAPEIPQDLPEIEDKSFRFALGQMETDQEKSDLLLEKLGPGTFERVAEDTFVIDAAKVHPSVRMELGLPDQGLVYSDKPGLTWYDPLDFLGASGAPLAGAIVAGGVLASSPLIIGMAGVGVTAAVFSAADEAIDYMQGRNRQSFGEVMAKVGYEGVINSLGEGLGRAIVGGASRLIKGPGPKYPQARADELAEGIKTSREADTGLQKIKNVLYPSPDKLGKQLAQEEAVSKMRLLVDAGAKPTIEATAQKSIAGTAQSLAENIMPKFAGAPAANTKYIVRVMEDVGAGRITSEAGKALIKKETEALAKTIDEQLKNPKEAFKIARETMDNVITKQLDGLSKSFKPLQGLPTEFTDGLKASASLFQASSNALYRNAGEVLDAANVNFDLAPVVEVIDGIVANYAKANLKPPAVPLFEAIQKLHQQSLAAGEGASSVASIETLQQLKHFIRLASKNPDDAISGVGDRAVSDVVKSIDDVMTTKLNETQQIIFQGFRLVDQFPGRASPNSILYPKYTRVPVGPAEMNNLKEGLTLWRGANSFYGEGQEKFNNAAVNAILKAKNAQIGGKNLDELTTIIKAGNVGNLKTYLDAVTPTVQGGIALAKPGADTTILQAKALFEQGNVIAGNKLLKDAGLDKATGILPEFVEGMAKDDSYWKTMVAPYFDDLDRLAVQAKAGGKPLELREAVRTDLGRQWFKEQVRMATTGPSNSPTINASALNDAFRSLDTEVQNTLFGAPTAKIIREALSDAHLLSPKNADDFFRQIDSVGDESLKIQAQEIRASVRAANEASKTALATAIAAGKITSPEDLVQAVLKDPKSYDQLVKIFGPDELAKPGGLRDAVLDSVIRGSDFESLFQTSGQKSVESGKWGKDFIKFLQVQNKNGVLEKAVGKETFKDLQKIADDSLLISDASKLGVGLAGSTGRLAVNAAFFSALTFAFGPAIAAMGYLASGSAIRGILRSQSYLKLLTSPRMRSDLYEKAIKDGLVSKELAQQAGNSGPSWYAINSLIDQFFRGGVKAFGTSAPGADRESPQGMAVREAAKTIELPKGLNLDAIRENINLDPNMLEFKKEKYTPQVLPPLNVITPKRNLSMTASDVERERARMGIAGLMG